MDVVSVVASVANIASLAIELAKIANEYFSDISTAADDIRNLTQQLEALHKVTEELERFLKDDAAKTRHFDTTSSVLCSTASSCIASLNYLDQQMKVGLNKFNKKLAWPFRKKEVETTVGKLKEYNHIFQFALTIEGCGILSQTSEDVTAVLQLQLDTSAKLHEITKRISFLSASSEGYLRATESMYLMLEGIRSLPDTSQQLSSIKNDLGEIAFQMKDERQATVLEWLSSGPSAQKHEDVRSKRIPGTGKWILQLASYKDWLTESSSTNLLWYFGPPGGGKTTLMSLLVDEFDSSSLGRNFAFSYYYCDYRAPASRTLSVALSNILGKLLVKLETLPPSIYELFEGSRRDNSSPADSDLEDILHEECFKFSYCFILIDAIDEFGLGDRKRETRFVTILNSLASAGVKVLVTSRAPPSIPLCKKHAVEKLDARETDIKAYISHTLHEDEFMQELLDDQLETEIINTIAGQANGTFLLPELHLQAINGQVSRSGIRNALKELSSDLGEAYDKTFEAINNQSGTQQGLAMNTLMWAASSSRPLRALELRHALATQPSDEYFDAENLPSLRMIVKSCCGLVSVDDLNDDASEVRLVHYTLQQYLRDHQTWFSQAGTMITKVCLNYLLFEQSPGISMSLIRYARDHWGDHAAHVPTSEFNQQALRLLMDCERLGSLFPENPNITGLHVAASFGLNDLIIDLIHKGSSSVSLLDDELETPLHKASARNQISSAIMLLEYGAKPNKSGYLGTTPLFVSAAAGNLELTEVLLDHGARVDVPDKNSWTALQKAADSGHASVVRVLLNRGASISSTSERGLSALHRAAGRGHVSIVQLLIDHGAQVNAITRDEWTPLHGAASSGQERAVRTLLDNGAHVDHRSNDGKTALHRACLRGHLSTIICLLERGADMMIEDKWGSIPLHLAARGGNNTAISSLLERDTHQLHKLNHRGWKPLQESRDAGHPKTSKLLREWELSVSGEGPLEETKLEKAISRDDIIKVKQILAEGIDLESQNSSRETPLHQAIQLDSLQIASMLLHAGADITSRWEMGRQPIHFAAMKGNLGAVKLCLEHGADVDAQTGRKQTPLHLACQYGSVETVHLLLVRGAGIEASDNDGWHPLHRAAAGGHEDVIRRLLEGGADVEAITDEGLTSQACAAQTGHHSSVELIRERRGLRRNHTIKVSRSR